MDWGVFWGAIGALAGVAALGGVYFTARTYRRQFAKREMQYRVTAVPLIRDGAAHARLRVMRGDAELQNPFLLTVSIRSASRSDIPSITFDGGRPIVFEVSPTMLVTETSTTSNESIGFTWTDQDVDGGAEHAQILPQLVRRRAYGMFSAVVDGRPTVTVVSPLIDVPLTEVLPTERIDRHQRLMIWLAAVSGSLAIALLTVLIIGMVNGSFSG